MKYISLLIKPASGSCNMACKYCFYRDVAENRSVPNYGIMSYEMLETLVKKTFDECEVGCSFAFQGGEPTLAGLDYYKKLVELQKKYNTKGVSVSNVIQTNGYGLGEEWAEFFKKEHFLVGVSLDADKGLHDTARVDHHGKGTYAEVMKTIAMLDKWGVDYNILCVLTSYVARYPERVYRFFKEKGFKYIQFIPCLDPLGEERGGNFYSLTAKRFETFFKQLFDFWYADCKLHQGISIRHFDNWLGLLMGYPPENCAMSGRCAVYFVVEADGSVYPCDFYVIDKYRLGSIHSSSFSELLETDIAKTFVSESGALSEDCMKCKYYYLCRGGCRRDREIMDDGRGKNFYCEAYKAFFEYSIDRFKEIAMMEEHPYGLDTANNMLQVLADNGNIKL